MTEEQNAGKILLFCKEPSPEQIMKCLRDAFDVPGSVHDADLKLHNGDLDVTIRVYCESAGGEEQALVRGRGGCEDESSLSVGGNREHRFGGLYI